MRTAIVTTTAGVAAILWVGVTAQQEVLPKPGPGSGITRVVGQVEITNVPQVQAAQRGDWQVAIGNTPSVRVTGVDGPGFIVQGQAYQITWADGQVETVVPSGPARDGWFPVDDMRRWINVNSARSIARAR
jgi:hypothetical protein